MMSSVLQGGMFTTYHSSLERANVAVKANGNTADIIAFKREKNPHSCRVSRKTELMFARCHGHKCDESLLTQSRHLVRKLSFEGYKVFFN